MRILPGRLAGLAIIEPDVHGDQRGFFARPTARSGRRGWASLRGSVRAGQPLTLAAGGGPRHALPNRRGRRRSSCAARAGAVWTSPSTCAAGRRPTASGRRCALDEESMRELYVPVGFAHGFCTLSEVADVIYKQSAYYDPESSAHRLRRPDVGIEWPLPAQRADRLRARRPGAAPGASLRASCRSKRQS